VATRVPEAAVLRLLREGKSQNAVARELGVGASSVSRIARTHGIPPAYAAPKNANLSNSTFAQVKRLKLIDDMVETLYGLMTDVEKASDFYHLTMSAAVLIDKRRLEDGEATSRAEVNNTDARDRIAGRIAQLAARSRTEGVA
jgi:hypothetical protein